MRAFMFADPLFLSFAELEGPGNSSRWGFLLLSLSLFLSWHCGSIHRLNNTNNQVIVLIYVPHLYLLWCTDHYYIDKKCHIGPSPISAMPFNVILSLIHFLFTSSHPRSFYLLRAYLLVFRFEACPHGLGPCDTDQSDWKLWVIPYL